jgi:hypothetical protein
MTQKLRTIDPRSWSAEGIWTIESKGDAITRTPQLGQQFFTCLFDAHPELARDAVFLRWSVQDEDTFAFFDRPNGAFSVQFDARLQYIIVVGQDGTNEIGEWFDEPAVEALRYIAEAYLNSN